MQNKEDGLIHPVEFASHKINEPERGYVTCEREVLSVIFSLKKFCVYLLSPQHLFLLNDHQALSYAFRKKDFYGRLSRWMDFSAE